MSCQKKSFITLTVLWYPETSLTAQDLKTGAVAGHPDLEDRYTSSLGTPLFSGTLTIVNNFREDRPATGSPPASGLWGTFRGCMYYTGKRFFGQTGHLIAISPVTRHR
jgi:hypothetical protein